MKEPRILGFLLLAAAALPAACTSNIAPPKVDLAGADPAAAWARVLARFVDARGRIDFAGLKEDPADLETTVAWIAATSPENAPQRFRRREEIVAYYINTYNALAMYNVIRSGVEPAANARFFWINEFLVGGTSFNLYEFERDIIRPLGEPRVHFALNCMSRSCPRLPQVPFTPDKLDEQLEDAAREFFDNPLNVIVFPEDRRVRLSQIMDFYTEDFLKEAPSLLAYVNRYRGKPVPEDYAFEFIPYDWTLNAQ